MSEREELVERVARAILRGDMNPAGNWHDYAPLANAAIAECEKALIESEDRNHDLVDTVLELEAQCAELAEAQAQALAKECER